jgi:hypothetical protein
LIWAVTVGAIVGLAYAVSPLTVWFLVWAIVLFRWAGRGLAAGERRAVNTILAAAIIVRVLAVAVLFLGSDHTQIVSFFWDGDGVFIKRRALTILNLWNGVPVHQHDLTQAYDPYGWSTYLYVLAYLQYLVGPAPYAVHLFNVALFVTAATLLYRFSRAAYGSAAALLGLTVVLFMPTLISWSVAALKESMYVLLCAIVIVSSVAVIRNRTFARRAIAAVVLIAAFAATNGLRAGASVITLGGVAVGLVGALAVRRPRLAPVIATGIAVGGFAIWMNTGVQDQILDQLRTAATVHAGNVNTTGHQYQLLDQRLYFDASIPTMTGAEAWRFVLRALVSFIAVPLPWQLQSRSELVFLPQQVLWYLLVICAVPGLVHGVRRDPLVTCVLVGVTVVAGTVIALNNGNIGTLVRFRDTVIPFLVWVSAFGATETVAAFLTRRRWIRPLMALEGHAS